MGLCERSYFSITYFVLLANLPKQPVVETSTVKYFFAGPPLRNFVLLPMGPPDASMAKRRPIDKIVDARSVLHMARMLSPACTDTRHPVG